MTETFFRNFASNILNIPDSELIPSPSHIPITIPVMKKIEINEINQTSQSLSDYMIENYLMIVNIEYTCKDFFSSLFVRHIFYWNIVNLKEILIDRIRSIGNVIKSKMINFINTLKERINDIF